MSGLGNALGSVAAGGGPGSGRDRLRLLGERVAPLTGAHERTLPLLAPLAGLFPGGALRRGWVIATGGDGATSLALAVASGPSAAGSWVAVVGEGGLGLAAAAEAGLALERLLLVAAPEPRAAVEAAEALLGAVDVVLVGREVRLGAADRRRLAAKLRERGSVLIALGGGALGGGTLGGVDVCLEVVSSRWSGLGDGWGLLRSRRVSVRATGRGAAGRPRSLDLLLPGPDGAPVSAGPAAAGPAAAAPAAAAGGEAAAVVA
ncbi:MAG: hypothetical protein F4X37_01645 [Acidimicrobiia bacterium]|nr:hypothetical protein [bacterium]MXZ29953.1 hypothetical protein [Acidimicrobiia bacterium]MYB23813.1 hypothetical protein [Acidimicrobiia bacterium]